MTGVASCTDTLVTMDQCHIPNVMIRDVVRSLMMTEMVLEMLIYLPSNHLMWLLA